jgi:class 3 adenylate cyclase/predicted ATPase
MTFEEVLTQAIQLLQRQGRVSYRALKRQFDLDDAYLADLTYEMVEILKVASDRDRRMLVWNPTSERSPNVIAPEPEDLGSKRGGSVPSDSANPSPFNPYPYEAERRQLTVMFCDLVDSTQLAEKLDPEDLREVFLTYQKVCAKAVASAEGYIAQYLGDGVLIYFGYPQAHEDDARRAVSSGLRILEAIKRLNPQIQKDWGVSLAIRIGIHTGLVIVGEMGVREAPSPMAVVGETPNIAARLQSIAEPNTLLVSAATHRLIAGFFEFSLIGRCPLKGISELMLVYRILHESTARNRFEVSEKSGLAPLVNRKMEWAFLLKHWCEARAGNSHAVLLQGEAGMGKSRIVWEFKKYISQEPDAWLTEIEGSPYYRNSAFHPIVELLQKFTFQFGKEDTPTEKLAKIESFLIQYTLQLEQYVPLFASLLSIPFESKYDSLNLSPERQKQKTIEALGTVFLFISIQQPVLLVVEDLHWMDASTLDVISFVLNQAKHHHLLTLLTFRPEFIPPWDMLPHVLPLNLQNLPAQEVKLIVEQTAQGKLLPQEVIRQIVQKTDGVPLFVEELTKTVIESKVLQENETSYTLTGALPTLSIPTTLHDSLIARLDRLAMVKEIAQFCATLSREFEYELIAAISPWEVTTLQNGLNQLVEAGLLYKHGVLPQATYQFKHALIQDAAYQSLLKNRRQQYHQRIAEKLESLPKKSAIPQPELLAYHFMEAGLAEKALYYWQKAGLRDLEQAANLEAIAHFSKGLEVLQRLPASPKRDRQELEMQLGLAPAYMAIKGWAAVEVEQASIRARDLSHALEDEQSRSASLWGLWTNYFLRGQMDDALETATAVFQMASANQPILTIIGCHAVGYTHHFRGEFSNARTYAEQGLACFNLDTERQLVQSFQFSSTVCIHMFLGSSLWMLGYPEQSSQHVADAMRLAQELENTPNTAYALAASCFYHHYLGDVEWILEKTEQLIQISQEESFLLWFPVAKIFHGWAITKQGKTAEGIAEIQNGLELFWQTGTTIIMPHVMVMMAEAYSQAGQLDNALTALEDGISESARRNERHMEPELYRLKAEVFLQQADRVEPNGEPTGTERVESCFQQSLNIARQQGALMLELRSATGLSRLWQRLGRRQEAHSLLLEVYSRFTEGWSLPDLHSARILLDELASDREV